MEDYLAAIRSHDKKERLQHERTQAGSAKAWSEVKKFHAKWKAVIKCCEAGDKDPTRVPDLSPFIVLARAFKSYGFDVWLPEMAATLSKHLDSRIERFENRKGQLFFVGLLIFAGKPRATAKQLAKEYKSISPKGPVSRWRTRGARDVQKHLQTLVEKAEQAKSAEAQSKAREEAKRRLCDLKDAATKRPTMEKQLFSVFWSDKGLGPAPIRDKWNQSRDRRDWIGDGESGRNDIKTATRRGREFIAKHSTSVEELSSLLNISFGV